MGASKTEHFSPSQNQLAMLAKALGHPARVAILEYLLKVNKCICGDIVNELPLAQPTVSQHLKELKLAGLIKGNVEGNAICYCINENTFQILQDWIGLAIKTSEERSSSCCPPNA
jgi:DNA-binding transcriptional ArsR family regulator